MPGPRPILRHPLPGQVRRTNTLGEEEWSFPVSERLVVADAAIAIPAGLLVVAMSAMTAARTHTLPSSFSVAPETVVLIQDEAGACSGTNILGAAPASGDLLNGSGSAKTVTTAYGFLRFRTNGAGGWFQI